MRTSLVAGNWKMNGTRNSITELLGALKQGVATINSTEIVVFPPYIFLEQVQNELQGSNIEYGAQNVYQEEAGAYTGEISPGMLRELGCSYVLVGHSERRQLLGETDQEIAEKFILAAKNGIKPVLCVGETQQEREQALTFEVIARQLSAVLNQTDADSLREAVIAYEPVWAIGTGLTATPEQAQEVHEFIRKQVGNLNKNLAQQMRIIYGGSVKQNNATALFSMPDIDGGLVGGASLNAKEFLEIAKVCQ